MRPSSPGREQGPGRRGDWLHECPRLSFWLVWWRLAAAQYPHKPRRLVFCPGCPWGGQSQNSAQGFLASLPSPNLVFRFILVPLGFWSQEAVNSPPPSSLLGLLLSSAFFPILASSLLFFFCLMKSRLPEEGEGRRETTPGDQEENLSARISKKQLPRYIIIMETFRFRVAEGEVNKPGVMGALPLSGMFYLPLVPLGKRCGQPSKATRRWQPYWPLDYNHRETMDHPSTTAHTQKLATDHSDP